MESHEHVTPVTHGERAEGAGGGRCAVLAEAREIALKPCFGDPILDVMNFLNEVVAAYPQAISFAPGRPLESLFHVEEYLAAVGDYVDHRARGSGEPADRIWGSLGQYSRTNGILGDVIARHLALDEDIHVDPEAIIVTVGAQEAMAIVLAGLFQPPHDVLLVSEPSYVGITGLARVLGIQVVPVPAGDQGLDPAAVDQAIRTASRTGRVRALYDIPDFNNPLGTSLSVEARHALLDVCRRHNVLIIEDNPYGMFAYDHERRPALKTLDRDASVLYIGSFSKTLFPGIRLGYLVADQRVAGGQKDETLARALSRVKSLLTCNTSPLLQAMAAGMLLRTGGSLTPIVEPKRIRAKINRDAMLSAIERRFAGLSPAISWNRPAGGFFLTLTLPFEFGAAELEECAALHGVIVSPMRFFCLGRARANQVRLSFSYGDPAEIDAGVERLARFVRARCQSTTAANQPVLPPLATRRGGE